MRRALLPGSFDPPTNGHLNLLERATHIFDAVDVVIAVNANKNYTFSADERMQMMSRMASAFDNVSVHIWDQLIVKFAEKVGARVMIRGVRALSDFAYEFELSMINKGLNSDVETFLIPTDPQYFVLRSTSIKELARLGGDISGMVPPYVAEALQSRVGRSR